MITGRHDLCLIGSILVDLEAMFISKSVFSRHAAIDAFTI